MSLTGLVLRHKQAVYLGTVMLAIGGFVAMRTLPAGAYPEVEFTRIVVLAQGGGLEAQDIVVAVTRPLEEAMSSIPDLNRIRSRSVRGAAEISLDFRPGADMRFALQQVQNRVETERPALPSGLDVTVERLTPSVFPMMQYELTGGDPALLRDLAQYTIRPRLARLPDVGVVEVEGGLVREIAVSVPGSQLASRGISVPEIADAIRSTNNAVAAGRVDQNYRQYTVMISGLATTPADVAGMVVRRAGSVAIRVGDVGQVSYGTADRFQLASGNGQEAALINVSRQPLGNTLVVERGVEAEIAALQRELPSGVHLESVYNQGALVRESIGSVRDAMLIGGALAILVLVFFLGSLRPALTAGLIVPLALAGALAGLALLHDSINLMSLGGLAVAIGLIIDDAVVVVENIERRLELGRSEAGHQSIQEATDEILAPVVGSTLTTIVVFAPLGLLEGVVGQFFRSFSLALACAVLLSLVLALTLIPALAGQLRLAAPASGKEPLGQRWVRRLHSRHEWLLDRLLTRRGLALAAGLGLVAIIVGAGLRVGTGFLPEMDEGGFILDYWTPTGTSLPESDRQLHELEAILRADPDIQAFTRRTGSELGFFATSPNRGDMTVRLKPRSSGRASVYAIMARVRTRVETELPGLRIEFVQILQDLIGDLAGLAEPVELKVYHADLATAQRTAARLAEAVDSVPGLVDLFDGNQGEVPEFRVQLDPVRVSRLGLTFDQASDQVRGALFGADAGAIRERDRLVPIRVRLADSERFAPSIAATLPIVGPGGWASLGELGTVLDTAGAAELTRENLRPVVRVTGAVDLTRSNLGSVMAGIRRRVASIPLPAGAALELGGQFAGQQEAFQQLLLVFLLAAGAVLLVMVLQFGDIRGPLLIIGAAILGLSGGILALLVTDIPFNVSSFMGLILLIGLVVKNGIILLDAARARLAEGLEPRAALRVAGRLRLRPILMTTLCTLAGLLPLALGIGPGAELQRPLAIVVIGGLSVSTLVTLFLLPVALDAAGALTSRRDA
ncbi:MAG TPA: efflux RND transporter permease subunit [Gemmatimonadales bacterium]|nr:efflux RND transporter permease subunit [Gemmatimonadales bacterium]